MELFSTHITDYLVKREIIKQEDYNVYRYGFLCGAEILLNLSASVFISILLHMEAECFLFFLFFIPLRSYIRGIHLSNYYLCFIFSCFTLLSVLLLVKFIYAPSYISCIIYLLSNIALLFIRYVDHPNRPVSKAEVFYFEKKIHKILFLSFVLFLVFYIFHKSNDMFLESLTFLLVALTAFLGKLKYRAE